MQEERGLISGSAGSKARQVLISKEEWQEIKMGSAAQANSVQDEASETGDSQESAQAKSNIDVEL